MQARADGGRSKEPMKLTITDLKVAPVSVPHIEPEFMSTGLRKGTGEESPGSLSGRGGLSGQSGPSRSSSYSLTQVLGRPGAKPGGMLQPMTQRLQGAKINMDWGRWVLAGFEVTGKAPGSLIGKPIQARFPP